jgi:hypothetical protein
MYNISLKGKNLAPIHLEKQFPQANFAKRHPMNERNICSHKKDLFFFCANNAVEDIFQVLYSKVKIIHICQEQRRIVERNIIGLQTECGVKRNIKLLAKYYQFFQIQ